MSDGSKSEPQQRFADSQEEVLPRRRGRLTIFFGMAPGVGKTYAMVQAAREEKLAGRDAVIGYLETHDSKATNTLARGLIQIPLRQIQHDDLVSAEMDLDAILARQPHIVLVDALAHANAPGSRHPQRYQDIRELLEAGVDVYTTLNLQNIASAADTVRQITGAVTHETVPDSVLDGAELKLVDLAPAKFLKRLREEMAYLSQDTELAKSNFFSESNLMALRELAWRIAAERVGRDVHQYMQAREIRGAWKSGHRLLAAINPNPAAEQIVRRAARLAGASNSPWLVLYVETTRALEGTEHAQITRALALAEELGAEVITTTDDDQVRGLLRIASQRNVTEIIIGQPVRRRLFQRDPVFRRLLAESGDIEIHVIRAKPETPANPFRRWRISERSTWLQYLIAVGVVIVITLIAYLFGPLIGGPHAAALIFLLAVVVLGSFVRRGPTLVAATMSALLWDYFILPPVYAFHILHVEDALLCGLYFMVALILGQLTTRIRAQQEAEHLREERATALYLLTRELSDAATLDHILKRAVQQMGRAFKAQIAVLLLDPPDKLQPLPHPASTFQLTAEELRTAAWTFKQRQRAGKFTVNLPQAEALYVPLMTNDGVMGVAGLRLSQSFSPTIHQLNLLDAFSQQIAFALDRHRLREVSEKAKLLAESERLSKTLLNSMSHEIRTPIAVIKSAVSNLIELKETDQSELHQSIMAAIQDATERLNRLVGNVLDITRLESGHVKPKLNHCDVSELIHLAASETQQELARHTLTIEMTPGLPMVPMDFVLMEQALTNLLSNAAFHTPPGTAVRISARVESEFLVMEVADRGPGISPDSLGRIFEKFYRGPNAPTGGTGLGLSLVKGLVEAQGGHVRAQNRAGKGALFTICLPLGNIPTVSVETS